MNQSEDLMSRGLLLNNYGVCLFKQFMEKIDQNKANEQKLTQNQIKAY
jgi:hypothetical protein